MPGAMLAAMLLPPMDAPRSDFWSDLDRCNVVWTSPSEDASGSMPLGNGEVGLNLWIEPSGDLVFYVSRTDAWSEASRLLKLGRVRVRLEPSPLTPAAPFEQKLSLKDGRAEVRMGGWRFRVFVDSAAPVVYVEGRGGGASKVTATVENWRAEPRRLHGEELQSSWTMQDAPANVRVEESAGRFDVRSPDAVVWWHRNETSVVPFTLRHQGLESVAELAKDPILHRTFGGRLRGEGFFRVGKDSLETAQPVRSFCLTLSTASEQAPSVDEWLARLPNPAPADRARSRTSRWWRAFWERSHIFVEPRWTMPESPHALRLGVDSNGSSRFAGTIRDAIAMPRPLGEAEIRQLASRAPSGNDSSTPADIRLENGFTVAAWIRPGENESGRIFDKLTAGGSDGFLFDTHPGMALRLIVGDRTLRLDRCLTAGRWTHVAATASPDGALAIYVDGVRRAAAGAPSVSQAYQLQRYMAACSGRGAYPIKFNGSIFTVDPKFAGGPDLNPDWRRWGDCYWWQNTRLPYFATVASGDADLAGALFDLFERVLPLSVARARIYYGASGVYFPETMTPFGTYANRDYGWDRKGKQPGDVDSPWWRYAWQQGLELTSLMLDFYDQTQDRRFLERRVLPMAKEVLAYFDSRFARDPSGRLRIEPTQAVETYWTGVVNDTPTVAGLHDVVGRLARLRLPKDLVDLVARLQPALPPLPVSGDRIAPAEKFDPVRSNVENPELYAIWPFRLAGVGRPNLSLARRTFLGRIEKASFGWQYDGQCAALSGLAEEAGRILLGKVGNSHPAFRFPAMWGPNYDWLPDQDHGSNILLTLQNMVLQPVGDKIHLLPAWPKSWNVRFRLKAPKRTTVEGEYRDGRLVRLKVDPPERAKDVILPEG